MARMYGKGCIHGIFMASDGNLLREPQIIRLKLAISGKPRFSLKFSQKPGFQKRAYNFEGFGFWRYIYIYIQIYDIYIYIRRDVYNVQHPQIWPIQCSFHNLNFGTILVSIPLILQT